MSVDTFVDTNVLVYARDTSAPQKQKRAEMWMHYLWQTRSGRLSYQVLQEFYVTVTEILAPGLPPARAKEDVLSLFAWEPIPTDRVVIEGAWRIQGRFKIAWWDSLIVSAAWLSKCTYLLTEDLQDGQDFEGIRIINPFSCTPADLFDAPSP